MHPHLALLLAAPHLGETAMLADQVAMTARILSVQGELDRPPG